jgi:hypothetical protein
MKVKFQTVIIYFLLGLLTFAYTCVIRLGLSMFNILYDPRDMGQMSQVSKVMAHISMIDVWQYLAWASLALSLTWGIIRSRKGSLEEPHTVPWICHLIWIMASFFGNIIGALDPFISVAYSIG